MFDSEALRRRFPDREGIEEILAPHLHRRFEVDDPEWRTLVRKQRRGWRLRRLRRALNGALFRRNVASVREQYEEHWSLDDLTGDAAPQVPSPVLWGEAPMLLEAQALKRLYLRLMNDVLAAFEPENALEVGAGNGRNLFVLSALQPQIAFAGLELAEAGVSAARALQGEDEVGEGIAGHAPLPLRDPTAHKRIDFRQGNAAALPFDDGSFDVVFSILALEQMESVRDAAMAEMARVARRAVVMIEPWRDFNATGIRRDRIVALDYFSARIDELPRYGLEAALVLDDLPGKLQMGVGLVLAVPTDGAN